MSIQTETINNYLVEFELYTNYGMFHDLPMQNTNVRILTINGTPTIPQTSPHWSGILPSFGITKQTSAVIIDQIQQNIHLSKLYFLARAGQRTNNEHTKRTS